MSHSLDQLFDALEQVTAVALSLADLAAHEAADSTAIQEAIQKRGILIEQLNQILPEAPAISYQEYNRMLILQRQGELIKSRLQASRNQLAFQTTANTAQHAYRHCLEGMVLSSEARHVDTA